MAYWGSGGGVVGEEGDVYANDTRHTYLGNRRAGTYNEASPTEVTVASNPFSGSPSASSPASPHFQSYDINDYNPTSGYGGFSGNETKTNYPSYDTSVWQTGGSASPYDAITQFYQQMLNRAPESQDVLNNWWEGTGHDLSKVQQGIFNSPEAQAYRASGAQAGISQPPTSNDPYGWIDQTLQSVQSTDDPTYWRSHILADPKVQAGDQSAIEYWKDRIRRGDGSALVASGQLQKFNDTPAGGTGGNYSTGNIFDDPATAPFMQLLQQRINQLQQAYQPPDMQPALDYLRNYFQQLQGPAYTPDQMALMQTQQFDPLMAQRDAARQQIIQRFAAQGMRPDSGPVQAALLQSDQNFEKLGTQARAGVATNAIGLQKQQQAQAASLGPMIAQLEQQQFNAQQAREDQALGLAQIPSQLAWSRLTGAQGGLSNINPVSLLNPLQSFQTQGYNQGAQFGSQLSQILPYLLSLFGG